MGKHHYWTVDMVEMLGTMTDVALGAKLGIPKDTVTGARIGRGIPPFCSAFSVQRKWTAEEVALLGTMTDREVGKLTGRTRGAVLFARKSREIAGVEHLGGAHRRDGSSRNAAPL
jgi:hypothetical protein